MVILTISEPNSHNNTKKSNRRGNVTTITTAGFVCPSCKDDDNIITDPESGEIVCSRCGQVISDKILETGPEWRVFGSDQSSSSNSRIRTGMSSSLARHDRGLATVIGNTDRDASGNRLDVAMSTRMRRLKTWDYRLQFHTSTDRSLRQAFSQLDMLKDKLGLSDVIIEKTAYIYRKAQSKMLIRGRTISGVVAAAIYIACREMGAPRTLKDIATACNVKRKELAKNYRLIYTRLDLKIPQLDPMKCIAKVANIAKLSEKTKRKAAEIMSNVTKREISAGKDPMGIAASVLYLSSLSNDEKITQADIAKAAGVTEVTIRNRAKDLKIKFKLK